jgi:hypothetical protein
MSKMGLHDPFGYLKYKLWPKERSRVKLAVWFPTTKSRESTWLPPLKMACNISLESSQEGLQLCCRPHLNLKFSHKVMGPQSHESPNFGNFGILIWKSRDKCHLDVGLMERHIVYYKGEGSGFPQVRAMVKLVSPSLRVACPSTKSARTMH